MYTYTYVTYTPTITMPVDCRYMVPSSNEASATMVGDSFDASSWLSWLHPASPISVELILVFLLVSCIFQSESPLG